MNVYIYANPLKDNHMQITSEVSCILKQNMHNIKISYGKEDGENNILQNILWCDIIITIGGDGTLLAVGKLAAINKKPILGVNTGRLGFLTALEYNQINMLSSLDLKHDFVIKKHYLLQVKINEDDWQYCLNDVTITKDVFANTVDLSIFLNDKLLRNFLGDGIIVSTPMGSTAYSLSVGGPIVDTDLAALIISGVAPHSLNNASLVISKNKMLNLKLNDKENKFAYIVFDGANHKKISKKDNICIKLSNLIVEIYALKNIQQFEKVDKKLKLK